MVPCQREFGFWVPQEIISCIPDYTHKNFPDSLIGMSNIGQCMIAQKFRYNLIPENFNLIIHKL